MEGDCSNEVVLRRFAEFTYISCDFKPHPIFVVLSIDGDSKKFCKLACQLQHSNFETVAS